MGIEESVAQRNARHDFARAAARATHINLVGRDGAALLAPRVVPELAAVSAAHAHRRRLVHDDVAGLVPRRLADGARVGTAQQLHAERRVVAVVLDLRTQPPRGGPVEHEKPG
jgi:hypothetical protein